MSRIDILETSDYALFRLRLGNRRINKAHVRALIESIKTKNLLYLAPIVVNTDMEVIDGQHRLEAAKSLGVPVYYIVGSELELDDIRLLNTNFIRWNMQDYLLSYIDQGLEDYKRLRQFSKEYGISISNAIALLGVEVSEKFKNAPYQAFKKGDFEIVDYGVAVTVAEAINRLKPYCRGTVYRDREFINALRKILFIDHIDMDRLVANLEKTAEPLLRQTSMPDYLHQFETVYNYGRSAKAVRLY